MEHNFSNIRDLTGSKQALQQRLWDLPGAVGMSGKHEEEGMSAEHPTVTVLRCK